MREFAIADCRFAIGARAICVAALTISILVEPIVAEAQQAEKIPRIGVLQVWSSADPTIELIRHSLRELGYLERRTIAIESRWAEGKIERLPALAAELVQLKPDAILTFGDPAIRAAQEATRTIPIVAATEDLVGAGLVASFARPGGNTTGVSILASELDVKRLELLKEALPGVSRMAALWDPGTGTSHLRGLETAARSLGVELQILDVQRAEDFPRAFETAKRSRAGALNVLVSPFLHGYRRTIIDLAAKDRLPAIFQWRETAKAGGLMSYGPTLSELFRLCAAALARVIKGAKPGDLPIEQPTKLGLAVNLNTSKALGLTIPQSVPIRADEVIR